MRSFLLFITLVIGAGKLQGRQLFTDNFDSSSLKPQWQIINGNWHIADVQDLRIAPAENGREFVLRSDSAGAIRLFVDLPPSSKSKKLRFSFSYYTYAKGKAPRIEAEFYKKEMKDGKRGKSMIWILPVKGMWAPYTKTLIVPADANQFRVVFFNPRSPATGKAPCLDVIAVSVLK
jgi:hypothetical protein